jgi:ABC-2 type transport system permease protein
MLVLPLYFLSGSMFPASNLPLWLTILNRVDPLTYAVDPMRRIVFSHLNMSPAIRARLDPGVTWFGWRVPTLLEVAVIAMMGLAMLGIAIHRFSKTD